jgi:hypothetical protein
MSPEFVRSLEQTRAEMVKVAGEAFARAPVTEYLRVRDEMERLLALCGPLADRICLNCGRKEPCMSEADLPPDAPGVPCTFDPTPAQLWHEVKRLQRELKIAVDLLHVERKHRVERKDR